MRPLCFLPHRSSSHRPRSVAHLNPRLLNSTVLITLTPEHVVSAAGTLWQAPGDQTAEAEGHRRADGPIGEVASCMETSDPLFAPDSQPLSPPQPEMTRHDNTRTALRALAARRIG